MPSLLKSLELTGYKTFATKQRFEFSDSITAIVGPNGSGKSNIADAIRWVLGEQSYRLLRGRKTDDMIFSGSDKRSRSGMASVTIVFDNTDGWLPIDFSEVSITRRAYRDGQNEYLINGSRVRLRDVTELLSRSGLSERTYTVIGQGLVDAALSLKADERRKLFEEAAGIGLYRSRKDQALRRLDNTKRNLERVRDILAELRPRLRSLERQAKRAEDHQHIQKDLKRTMREWYGYHWHKSQKDLHFSKAFAEKQEKELASIKDRHQVVSEKLNLVRNQIQSKRVDLTTWQQTISEKHRYRENFSREIAVAEERIRSLNTQLDRDKQEITRLEDERTYREEQAKITQAELDAIQADFRESDDRLRDSQAKLDTNELQKSAIHQEINQISNTIQKLNNQNSLSTAKIEEFTNRILEIDQQIINTNEQRELINEELTSFLEKIKNQTNEIEKIRQQESDYRSQAENKQSEINTLRQKIESIKDGIDQSLSENAQLKAEQAVLQDAEHNLTGYASGTKVLLQPQNKSQFSALGSLNTLISVDKQYEQAIAALLNLFMDAVVLESNDAAERALDFLASQAVKTALVPISNKSTKNTINLPSNLDSIDFASDLIETDSKYKAAINNLLHNCIVVNNRQVAKTLINQLSREYKVATLTGEVFFSNGAIIINSEESATTLARPRKIGNISEKIEKNINVVSRKQAELDDEKEKLAALEKEVNEIEANYLQSSNLISEAQQKSNLLTQEKIRFEQKSEWQKEQVENFALAIRKTKDQIGNERIKIKDNSAEIEIKLEEQRNKKAEVASINVSELESQVAHWGMIHALGQEKLRNAQSLANERKNAFQGVEDQIGKISSRIEQSGDRIGEIRGTVSSSSATEEELQKEISLTESKISPAREALESLETEYDNAQAEEESTRNNLNIADRHTNQAQMSYLRQQEAFSSLQDRIQDDFGLVSFQYESNISGPTPLPLDGYVEELPIITELSEDIEDTMKALRNQLRRIGSINPEAHQEYKDVKERHEFLTTQSADLEKAETDVRAVISELDDLMRVEFRKTFDVVAEEFKTIFTRLFGGGHAELILTNEEEISEAGIEIEAKLPGKRMQRLSMLSGGERSLTAAALVFSLIKASPTPFCVMDEVDAMLDESNVGRFCEMLDELSADTQFVVITHNRNTVQTAHMIYGITMGKDTASQTISLRLEDVDDRYSSQ